MALDSVGRAAVSARKVLLDGLALRIGPFVLPRAPESDDLYSPTGLDTPAGGWRGGAFPRSPLDPQLEWTPCTILSIRTS